MDLGIGPRMRSAAYAHLMQHRIHLPIDYAGPPEASCQPPGAAASRLGISWPVPISCPRPLSSSQACAPASQVVTGAPGCFGLYSQIYGSAPGLLDHLGVLFQHVAVAEAYLPPGLARVCAPPYAQPGSKAAAATVGAEGNYKHWRGSFGSCGRVRRPSGRRSRVAVNLAESKSSWGIRATAAKARPGRLGGPKVTPWRHRASGRPRPESAGAIGTRRAAQARCYAQFGGAPNCARGILRRRYLHGAPQPKSAAQQSDSLVIAASVR